MRVLSLIAFVTLPTYAILTPVDRQCTTGFGRFAAGRSHYLFCWGKMAATAGFGGDPIPSNSVLNYAP
jgi:hypothetical protein